MIKQYVLSEEEYKEFKEEKEKISRIEKTLNTLLFNAEREIKYFVKKAEEEVDSNKRLYYYNRIKLIDNLFTVPVHEDGKVYYKRII